jgi:hypothetical protein
MLHSGDGALELRSAGTGTEFDLAGFLAESTKVTASFGGVLALRLAKATLSLLDFLLKTNRLGGGIFEKRNQAAALGWREIQRANQIACFDHVTSELNARGTATRGIGFRNTSQTRSELKRGATVVSDAIEKLEHLLRLLFELLLGHILVVELHNFADGTAMLANVFRGSKDLIPNQRRTGDNFEDAILAALNALRNSDFFFTGKQTSGTRLAKIHANRVLGELGPSSSNWSVNIFLGFGRFGADHFRFPVVMKLFLFVYSEQVSFVLQLILEFEHV